MAFCHCGQEIPERRVAFLEKAGYKLTCINHSTTQKMGAHMEISGKTGHEWKVCPPDEAERLHKAQARKGTGISNGARMNQQFSAKHLSK